MGKPKCPGCGREVDQTKFGKYAPHDHPSTRSRCHWSGSRVVVPAAKKEKEAA